MVSGLVALTFLSTSLHLLNAFKFKEVFTRSIIYKFAIDPKQAAKDEQYRIQQEILARRKKKGALSEYFKSVELRRKENWKKDVISSNWKGERDGVDPLQKWKDARDRGEIKSVGYEPEPPKSSSLFGINIPIPINPIGIPKYDSGERFDLRLPYAEVCRHPQQDIRILNFLLQRGYEDPDADILGKIGRGISSFFGGNKPGGGKGDTKNSDSATK